jgi:orotate phosphoribosyltransferase
MQETIDAIRERGGEPVSCGVLVDKKAEDMLEGVPLHSLVQAIGVGEA